MSIEFPQRLTKLTEDAWVVLQNNLDFLGDLFDKAENKKLSGTITITSGNTFADVLFIATLITPAVVVTPVADPGARYWISNRTTGGFRINQGVAAPVAGVAYDWLAKGV